MRIIIISRDGDILDLAYRLKQEGHKVKVFIKERALSKVGDGFGLTKVKSWEKELPWVGKDGLIIFDQSGFGKIQDELRGRGYSVVGGSEGGDSLEFDRFHAQEIFKKCGLKTVQSRHFVSPRDAIAFIEKHRGQWVVKQNGHADKCFSYVGRMHDGSDVINLLSNYEQFNNDECRSIDLQEKVDGVEIAVARYFNGKDWVGPIEMNIEHKKLFPGNLGPKTSEMGTLMWYDDNENNKLFNETLSKLKPYLQKIGFIGDIDINCIVNETGATPLEATPRFGYPAVHLHSVLNLSKSGELLKAIADGKRFDLKWRRGFGIVVQLAVPPFPYTPINGKYNPQGLRIFFRQKLTDTEWEHIHFSEVSSDISNSGEREYVISANGGYVMCVTGVGRTVQKARETAYELINKILIPKMFYRNDIGLMFVEKDKALLKKWGYL